MQDLEHTPDLIDEISDPKERIEKWKHFASTQMSYRPEVSKIAIEKAIDSAKENNFHILHAQSLVVLSNIHYNLRDLDAAFEATNSALSIYEQEQNEQGIAKCYNAIAAMSGELERYDTGINYLEKALALNESNHYWKDCVLNCMNIGFQYSKLNQGSKSLNFFLKAQIYVEKIEDEFEKDKMHLSVYQKVIDFYDGLKDYDNAKSYIKMSLDLIRDRPEFNEFKAVCKLYEGNVFEHQGQIDHAIEACELGYELSTKAPFIKSKVFEKLSDLYKTLGNYEKSLHYYSILYEDAKLKFQVDKENAYQSLITKFDVENKKKEAEINRLKYVEIAEKNKIIEEEKQKSDELLLNIFPSEIAEELKKYKKSDARYFEHTSVLFADIINFTSISESLSAKELVDTLHYYFKNFDAIVSKRSVEKIKTIGDCYMCAAGLPNETQTHAKDLVETAMEIQEFIANNLEKYGFNFRMGIHSGPLVAGIVGVKKYAYDIWGDTVNTAARMEQNSEGGKINITEATYELIKDDYICTYRGKISVKNKGEIGMYFVDKRK